jgi:hypothetical protein
MNFIKFKPLTSFLFLLGCCSPSYGAEHGHEQHEAHIHGEARLFVAKDKNRLDIEFSSPGMNIVGFEHQPETQPQASAVKQAIKLLKQAKNLFMLPVSAACTLVSAEATSPIADHYQKDEEHDHNHQHHSDFTAHYQFECSDVSKLNVIQVNLFEHFPATHRIEAQTISNLGQRKIELTPENNTLTL